MDKPPRRKRPRRAIPIEVVWHVEPLARRRGFASILHFAEEADLPYPTASDLWHGVAKRIDRETLARVCYALDCQPGDLFVIQKRSVEEQPT